MIRTNFSIAVIATLLISAIPALTLAGDSVSWTGCGISKKAFMSEMAAAYEKKTGIAVKLSGGGATKGIRATAAGNSDMGGSCRYWLRDVSGEIHGEEQDAELIQVAWDALVVIANPGNKVNNISMDELKKVYDGKITNWKELGGVDKRIALVTRKGKTSGVGMMFRKLAFGNQDYEFKARSLKVKSTGPLEKKVESVKSGLAIDGISSAKKRNVKVLAVDGAEPSKANIGSGKYPLYRPLYIVLKKSNPSKKAKAFIDFVLSDEGQAIISSQGTVNLKEGEALNSLWKS